MELPPSGWYPDPYGVPGLLRWWDGSTWTQHTHASSGTDATDGGESSTPPTAQQTTVQPAVRPTTVQPAVPATTVQPAVQPGAQATTVQPTTVQPTTVQPAVQPRASGAPGTPGAAGAFSWSAGAAPAPQEPDGSGTQVLFLGDDAWTTPGIPGEQGDRYGYHRAQRRRRMLMSGGLVGGTAAALGLIALVVSSLAGSHPAPAPTRTPSRPAVTTKPPAPSPTASPTVTASATPVTDGASGLSYTQLPTPWQPNCPGSLNQGGFTWSKGESAIAAQINGGQTTWYGEACSAPLPQQYGYNGVADLENVTTQLVNQFTGTYYNALPHGYQQEVSQPVTVSGHAGWEIKYMITYQNPQGLAFSTEEGAVVVTDLGSAAAPAVFFTSIPSNLGESNVDSLVSSLQVSVPPQPGGGGSPGDGSPGDGSPGDGQPGGSPGDGGGGQGN